MGKQYVKSFRKGDTVKIKFNEPDISVSQEMRKFNGAVAVIDKRVPVVVEKQSGERHMYYYYTLKDIVSSRGIPFSFTADMLTFA